MKKEKVKREDPETGIQNPETGIFFLFCFLPFDLFLLTRYLLLKAENTNPIYLKYVSPD